MSLGVATMHGPPSVRARWPGAVGASLSLLVHASLALYVWRLPPSPLRAPIPLEIEIALPAPAATRADDAASGETRREAATRRFGGGRPPQNIDAFERGAGGDGVGAEAVMLFPRADALTQLASPRNTPESLQMQRIRTADDQATRSDRRATPNPGDVPFLASGAGVHPERRAVAAVDPRDGARSAPTASVTGDAATRNRTGTDETRAATSAEATHAGARLASPGRGIAAGTGTRESDAARVAAGRPPIPDGSASTSSDWQDARVRDRHDAELLAANLVQALADTSAHGGRSVGAGSGGVGGGSAAGSGGGRDEGGRARTFGPGDGDFDSLDTRDARYERWLLAQVRRVERVLIFPAARRFALDQGTSVYRLEVRGDGRLAAPLRLLRSSGFADLDAAARRAIDAALPLEPVPAAILAGRTTLRLTLPVHFSNPSVR
jgi:TonB family protein